jgi:V/A-type H+-transporting ATPase subunit C
LAVDFTYAVARLRAIEASMPDRAWFMRMVRSDGRQLLSGAREYYAGFEQVEALHEFEKGIEADTASLFELLTSVLGECAETEFLRAAADFDNYVLAVKGRMLDAEPVLADTGTVPPDVIGTAAGSGDPSGLTDRLKKLHDVIAGPRDRDEPAALDREGEKAKWSYMLATAPSREAAEWVRLRIDRANIKSFARLRLTGLRRGGVSDVWIPGGTIEASRFASLYSEPFEDFLSFLGYTEWRGLLSRGFDREMPAWKIDTALDAQLLDLMSGARSRFFDIMPLLYHVELRERNARVLRTIFTGRINNLPEDDTAESVEALLA